MANVLLIDDDNNFSTGTAELLRAHDHHVVTADTLGSAREVMQQRPWDLLMIDLMLPDGNGLELLEEFGEKRPRQVVVITGHPGIKNTIAHLHGPGLTYLTKPIDVGELMNLTALGSDSDDPDDITLHFGLLVGESPKMHAIYDAIRQVAPTDTAVLINGESGTGKELVAEALHRESKRGGSFVPVNCGALTPELIASELFGHEKGSFTGASKRHIGSFERAESGTLFLDEITEMPIEQQPHLLRALENSTITRVGGEGELPSTARVVAACNRPMAEAIESGALREDLYYRLSIFPIELPPLRERAEDIEPLALRVLHQLNSKNGTGKTLGDEGLERLKGWHWPGNVRELKHTIHRCYISTPGDDAELNVPDKFAGGMLTNKPEPMAPGRSIKDVERELILSTLDHYDGDKKAAAETLGVSLKTLYNRLAEYDQEQENAE